MILSSCPSFNKNILRKLIGLGLGKSHKTQLSNKQYELCIYIIKTKSLTIRLFNISKSVKTHVINTHEARNLKRKSHLFGSAFL